MGTGMLTFGDIEIEKKCYRRKTPVYLKEKV